ncbi:MAG: non-heme iron oxygenase ferredoxin subunit [Gammaproteobacteria bacterium]|nr:MAG: non-heme iron oxygenase ferredoxin subunit [Gammaproteobacteria bacterium]
MTVWTDVANVDELLPGAYKVVDVDDVLIAVFNINGEYFAIENICTHDGECLTGGDIEGEEIICPRHGARFNIKTGEALTAPAYEPTATFPVRIENNVIQVRDDRWD